MASIRKLSTVVIFLVRICIYIGDSVIRVITRTGAIFVEYTFFLVTKLRVGFTFFSRKVVKTISHEAPSVSYALFLYRIKYFIFGFIIAFTVLSVKSGIDFINSLPNISLVENNRASLSSHIYDRNGKMLYEVYRDQNRTPVHLSDLPMYVKQATIAVEDREFYSHNGISIFGGMLRAVRETVLKKQLQGGSTITQQLVKSALLTPERTFDRKIKEVLLALLVERKYTKDQILEMYLNQVPYGGTAWGIEEAAKMYFGKSAKELILPEAALLAGLPQAPSTYSPYSNPSAAKQRQKSVLLSMVHERYITQKKYNEAIATQLNYRQPNASIRAPHFVFYVKNQLEQEFGPRMVQEGGLNVYTTLDYSMQKTIEQILSEEIDSLQTLQVGNGAVLVTQPSTGEILAMVGSKDFFEGNSGAFNVTTGYRQPGSSIKPITYTLALKRGITAASLVADVPTKFYVSSSESYSPVNYDSKFHGLIPVRYALANSYNIPAVKMLEYVGVGNFIGFANRMGITTWESQRDRFGLSLTLGGGEVTMLEMATAYGTIRNLGIRKDLTPFRSVQNSIGQELYRASNSDVRAISEEEPFIVSDILSDNVARTWAFGPNSVLNFGNGLVSVKTGTTDYKKDNWTIGYTRPTVENQTTDVLVTVWVGNNDNTPMNPTLTSGITGAAPIWRRVMDKLVSSKFLSEQLLIPSGVETKKCYFGRTEYFVRGTAQRINCNGYMGLTPTPTP